MTRWMMAAMLAVSMAWMGDAGHVAGQTNVPAESAPSDRRLYVVSNAHLDTQWMWTVRDTVREHLPRTVRENIALFEKHPGYVFNFEGAYRYMLLREYHPELYVQVQSHAKAGRWRVAGNMVDAPDTNLISSESLVRHILYGRQFFREELGQESADLFLPDCFGFSAAVPSVAAHCGLLGFSTSKLSQNWAGYQPPFDIGRWVGPDGQSIVAALQPGSYGGKIATDLSQDAGWIKRIDALGKRSGLYAGYMYYGVGDTGGSPTEDSVARLMDASRATGPVRVIPAASDAMFRAITPEQKAALPVHVGELLMQRHGVGAYTSHAELKRFNRLSEQLADAAERAATLADWMGVSVYPGDALRTAWTQMLWHHHHDDLPGTSIPEAYTFSWNDYSIVQNLLAGVLSQSLGAIAAQLDTRVRGVPVVLFNPLSAPRRDVVEVEVRFAGGVPAAVRAWDAEDREVPAQILAVDGEVARIALLPEMGPASVTVVDVRPADRSPKSSLTITESSLASDRLRVALNSDGDIASVMDAASGREWLASPCRLQILEDTPSRFPAWELDYDDMSAAPRHLVGGPVHTRIVERGPVRVALETTRMAEGSTIVQRVSLTQGSPRVEVDSRIHWQTRKAILKAAFPTTVSSTEATYDIGVGAVRRGTNTSSRFEVPAQQWADMTTDDGGFGVAILNDCHYGHDKPDDHTLRLSLVRNPDAPDRRNGFPVLAMQDLGHHQSRYAILPHVGGWEATVPEQAARFNQPVYAFQTQAHAGERGRTVSLVRVSGSQVAVRALKRAERSDEIVVRLQELTGRPAAAVTLRWPAAVRTVRDITGAEESLPGGDGIVTDGGAMTMDLAANGLRTVALRLAAPSVTNPQAVTATMAAELPFDSDIIASRAAPGDGALDGEGRALPGDAMPKGLVSQGVPFALGAHTAGALNAVACKGQRLALPPGESATQAHLLLASAGHVTATFTSGRTDHSVEMPASTGFIGQWDSPIGADGKVVKDVQAIRRAYRHDLPIAWFSTHHMTPAGPEVFGYAYVFHHRLMLDPGTERTLKLPDVAGLYVLALTVTSERAPAPAASLFLPR